MPPSDEQNRLSIIRQPARDDALKLAEEIAKVIREKDVKCTDDYHKDLVRIQKTSNRIRSHLKHLDIQWVNNVGPHITPDEYRAEYQIMENLSKVFDDIDAKVDVELALLEETVDPTTKNLDNVLSKFAAKLDSFKTEPGTSASSFSPANSSDKFAEVLSRLALVQEHQAHNLPVLTMKKFKDDITYFLPWWDEFRVHIHDREHLSDIQKFQYLKDLLTGEAARSIENIPLTGANYTKAVSYILKRYGNVENIVIEIFAKMLELPKIHKLSDYKILRQNLDKISNYVITLETMKLDEKYYSSVMYPILLRTLPESLSLRFINQIETKINLDDSDISDVSLLNENSDLPKLFADRFSALREFISKEVTTREQADSLLLKHENRNNNYWNRKLDDLHFKSETSYSAAKGVDEKKKLVCAICKGSHLTVKCKSPIKPKQKLAKLKEAGFCIKCLKKGHDIDNCRANIKCFACQGDHHKVVCDNHTATNLACIGEALLPTGHVSLVCNDKIVKTRFILDSGSQRNYILKEHADSLGLKPKNFENLWIHVFGQKQPRLDKLPVVEFHLKDRDGELICLEALVTPEINSKELPLVPSKILSLLANPAERPDGPKQLGILLSAVDMMNLIQGSVTKISENILVLPTKLGDVLVGNLRPSVDPINTITMTISIEDFWKLDHFGILPEELNENKLDSAEFVQKAIKCIKQEDGRYSTIMQFDKHKEPLLADNYAVAKRQAESLVKNLKKNPELKKEYIQQMEVFFENDFAEVVPKGEVPRYFLPHFPVINESKTSYKVRPVFNASSHAKGQLSLNDCILDVPNLLPTSVEMLLKFRRHKIGLIGDITKAYLMVEIQKEFRNHLCFIWARDTDMKNFRPYRMTRNTFGVKDAQFNTIIVLRNHASQFLNSKPNGAKAICENLYLDDLVAGGENKAEVLSLKAEVFEILQSAGMLMRKWRISGDIVHESESQELNLWENPQSSGKVLGIVWNSQNDFLTFNPKNLIDFVSNAKPCKRTILGAAARLHDPIGFISPFVMLVKLLLQKIHLRKLSFDHEISGELLVEWKNWCNQLKYLENFQIERCHSFGVSSELELHIFADASKDAYAAVVYLKSKAVNSEEYKTSLLISKSRLAPLKQLLTLTIPRKELMAAVCAVRLAGVVERSLNLKVRRFFWTDSMNVFYWIKGASPEKHGIFIKNRLVEILKLSNPTEWNHVPGKLNPADLPSRGITMEKLLMADLWMQGPDFLKSNEYPDFQCSEEVTMTITHSRSPLTGELFSLDKFSVLYKPIRIMATIFRVIARMRFQAKTRKIRRCRLTGGEEFLVEGNLIPSTPLFGSTASPLTAAELIIAKHRLIREAQTRCFREGLESSELSEHPQLQQLDPFVDRNGIVRVGGRLGNLNESESVKHPMILGNDRLTRLIIDDIHQRNAAHLRTDVVLTLLRQEFWVLRARQLVKSFLKHCVTCRRFSARPGGAIQAPLPGKRIEEGGIFRNVGVDYFGPFVVKPSKALEDKVWVALFTCSVTRAVHLEVVEDLSASAFLNTLKRFVATRGVPVQIISDNGLNFVRSARALKALWDNLRSAKVQNYMGEKNFRWSFNAPRAAWWGGQFERLIRIVKDCLRKTMKMRVLNLFDFITVIKEVEAIINSRPLTVCPAESEAPVPLTPAHFVSPRVPLSLPTGSLSNKEERPDALVKFWKSKESLLNDFWNRWRNEYLLLLKSAHTKAKAKGELLKVGDIVIIHDDNVGRLYWKLGRVTEVIQGKDGVSRTCKLKTGQGQLIRAVQHLYKIIPSRNIDY